MLSIFHFTVIISELRLGRLESGVNLNKSRTVFNSYRTECSKAARPLSRSEVILSYHRYNIKENKNDATQYDCFISHNLYVINLFK